MPDQADRTSKPEDFGTHRPGQPDAPEENNARPGHDGQPDPGGANHQSRDTPDLDDVEPGSDADRDEADDTDGTVEDIVEPKDGRD